MTKRLLCLNGTGNTRMTYPESECSSGSEAMLAVVRFQTFILFVISDRQAVHGRESIVVPEHAREACDPTQISRYLRVPQPELSAGLVGPLPPSVTTFSI